MSKFNIITGLDIGTDFIKVLVVRKVGRDLEILAQDRISSSGLRKGVVVDIEKTSKNIQSLLSKIQKTYDQKINSVFVNIEGGHLYVIPSDGVISVSRADKKISQEDIDRVLKSTQAINLPLNQEILDTFPLEFIIDDQKGIKEPLGLTGIRLEVKVLLLCAFKQYLKNLVQSVLDAKLRIDDIIPSPLAAARAVLTSQQKESGVALIDIGATTTGLAVFEEGDLIHFVVFPIGSANITNDIAIGLRTEIVTADEIKKQFGSCLLGRSKKEKKFQGKKKIEIFDDSASSASTLSDSQKADKSSPIILSQKILVNIIEARVSEIFDLIQKELKKISRQELLPGGVVLTGGGARLSGITDLVKQKLKLPCKIGIPQGIIGLEDDPSLATVSGLVLEGVDFEEDEEGILGHIGSKLKKIFRIFIP